jgi:hypothetical protein
MEYGLQYHYIRDGKNNPSVVIAFSTVAGSSLVQFQIATRNNRDAFSKVIARKASSGRLAMYPITLDMGKLDSKHWEITDAIVEHLRSTNFEGVHYGPITRETVSLYTSKTRPEDRPM